ARHAQCIASTANDNGEDACMCMMVYLAADRPLPLIPWDEERPDFWVRAIIPCEVRVRKQFTKPHVYYGGAHSGCGCGFRYGLVPIEGEDRFAQQHREEEEQARESVRRLSAYVADAVDEGSVEIYACWDGDQEAAPEERSVIAPAGLGGPA